MAFGAVHVPGVSGRDFLTVQEKTADALIAERILAFGGMHNAENCGVDAETAGKLFSFAHQQVSNRLVSLDNHAALVDSEILGETQEITLTNTQSYPFNSSVDSPVTVALQQVRKNLFYTVEASVKSHSGLVGDIVVTDKALNGFKIAFTGSGTSVTLTVRIKGGMT